jgi:hypothetical protein
MPFQNKSLGQCVPSLKAAGNRTSKNEKWVVLLYEVACCITHSGLALQHTILGLSHQLPAPTSYESQSIALYRNCAVNNEQIDLKWFAAQLILSCEFLHNTLFGWQVSATPSQRVTRTSLSHYRSNLS